MKDVIAIERRHLSWQRGEALTSIYPAPAFIRSDNGPVCIGHALRRWYKGSGTTTAYVEPGSPWQNGFAESFNCQFSDEFLNIELFATVDEAQGLANRWRWEYTPSGPIRPSRGVCPWRQLK